MTDNSHIISRLRSFLGKDQILSSDLWREIYARDASYFDIPPLCVVRPTDAAQVAAIMSAAAQTGIGVTFRCGGTSLSGQTLGEGIICELRGAMNRIKTIDGGRKVWFEPGITARDVNRFLLPYHTHIGPDPASSQAAMMGGILANNSSGMSAGVKYNSYHTLDSIEFILPSGHRYDTALADDRRRFKADERELCQGLEAIRREILADAAVWKRITDKYSIKNVTGYAMNSFVDFDDPLDICSHLLIGSEGTLAYIVSARLNTVPLFDYYTSSLLYFKDVASAAAAAAPLGETGALAVELMDYASLRTSMGLKSDLPQGTTALLLDYGENSGEALASLTASLSDTFGRLHEIIHSDPFTTTVTERERLWRIRDGVFPCVAGARLPGNAVILEDAAAPVERLDLLVTGMQRLFARYGYHGAIFGHARDGNIHPLITPGMKSSEEVDTFRAFMDGFTDLVLSLDGSLKGEHGTGRAIAPFVEREWGQKIYGMMKRVKRLADPQGILNPGVMINSDPEAFIKPLKSLDIFGSRLGYDRADRCIECGYCEHVCPTRYITLTPRQRLQARRIIARTGSKELEREYSFIGNESCCTDGSCQMPCPMDIDTGIIADALRARTNPRWFAKALELSADHYGAFETSMRAMLRGAVTAEKIISPYPLIWATDFLHRLCSRMPHWSKYFPMPARLHYRETADPDFIYFPACVTRVFGASSLGKDDMITVMLRVADRAGFRMAVPKAVHGLCCSQIWEHKGNPSGQKERANRTVEAFYSMSHEGRIPIVCDTTSCTHTLLQLASKKGLLTPENKQKYSRLKILDILQWLAADIMPRLRPTHRKKSVLLHPTCASRLLGLDGLMEEIAGACAEKVTAPGSAHCCGAAGDRGMIYPKVARAATRDEKRDIEGLTFDGCYSLARTCEISMCDTIGRPYEPLIYLVDETCSAS